MAGKSAILSIQIISDATKAAQGFDQAEGKASKWADGLTKASTVAVAAIGAVATVAYKQASALEQSSGAVEAVFGNQAAAIDKAARAAQDSLGLARSEYQDLASTFGAQLKNMGIASDQLVPTTEKLITLGGDLAATFGGTTSEAVQALGSLMRGERDPIERFGVSIKAADVAARLAATGQDHLTGAARQAAETEATLAILYEQTADAQGQRTRESGSAEAAEQRLTAAWKNASAELGTALLPLLADAATKLAAFATWAGENATTVQILAGVVGGLAVTVLAVNAAMKTYQAMSAAATAAQWLWNAAMLANPIGLIIIGVIALIAFFVVLYQKSETFRDMVQDVGHAGEVAIGWIVDKTGALVGWFKTEVPNALNTAKNVAVTAFDAYTTPIQWVIDKVSDLIGWIDRIDFPSPPKWMSSIGGAFGLGGPPPGVYGSGGRGTGGGSAPSSYGGAGGVGDPAYMLPTGGGSAQYGGDTIIIQGAIDPVATANQVDKILRRRKVRQGVTVVAV